MFLRHISVRHFPSYIRVFEALNRESGSLQLASIDRRVSK